MQPPFGIREPDADHPAPRRRDIRQNIRARPPETDNRFRRIDLSDRAELVELTVVSGVRRRRQQNYQPCAAGQRVYRRPAMTSRCCRVRFVQHEQVPADILQRPERLGAFHEISRGQVDAGQRPRIHLRGKLAARRVQPPRAGIDRFDPEKRAQLLLPLVLQRGGHEDQDPAGVAPSRDLPDDQSCLHRLSNPHIVCDEQARDAVPEHGEGRLELIRKQSDGWRTAPEAAVREGFGNHSRNLLAPSPCRDHRETRGRRPARAIERNQERASDAGAIAGSPDRAPRSHRTTKSGGRSSVHRVRSRGHPTPRA